MKKLSLLVMAMVMSIVANAAWVKLGSGANGWSWSSTEQETETIAKWENQKFNSDGFKIFVYDGNDHYYGLNTEVAQNEWVALNENTGNAKIKGLDTNATYTVEFNLDGRKVRIVANGGNEGGNEGGDEPVVEPSTVTKHLVKGPAVGSWDNSHEMTYADGVYSYTTTFSEGEFGVYSVDADGKQIDFFHAGDEKNITEANKAYATGDNGNFVNKLTGKYTLVFDAVKKTVTFKSEGGNEGGDEPIVTPPTPVENGTFYLRGGFTGEDWAVNEDYKFTFANGVYTLTVAELKGGADFKIADANWNTPYSSENQSMELGVSYTLNTSKDAGNMALKADAKNVTLTFDQANETLVISADGGDEPIVTPPTPTGDVYCIHGQIVGGSWDDIKLEEKDGKWSYTGDVIAGEFGFKKNGNWIYGGGVNATEENVVYNINSNGGNSKSTIVGTYTVTFDPEAKTIVWTPFYGEIEHNYTYALHGQPFSSNGSDWAPVDMTLDETNGTWVYEGNVKGGHFGIQKLDNGTQVEWHQFLGANGEDGAEASLNTALTTVWEKSDTTNGHFVLSNVTEGNNHYKFVYDPEASTLLITNTTGVAAVEVENGAAVYYNLQGVRVANPEKGLFIVVKGNKATKVVL